MQWEDTRILNSRDFAVLYLYIHEFFHLFIHLFINSTISGGSTMRPAGAYARAQLGIFFGYKPNIFLLVLKNK